MTFKEYQALARRTQNPDLNGHQRLLHALHGMSAEVGEIHAIYQKQYQGHDINYHHLLDEASDLLWFIAEFCDVMGVSMDSVAEQNIDKLRKRFPNGFDPERSLHREAEG